MFGMPPLAVVHSVNDETVKKKRKDKEKAKDRSKLRKEKCKDKQEDRKKLIVPVTKVRLSCSFTAFKCTFLTTFPFLAVLTWTFNTVLF